MPASLSNLSLSAIEACNRDGHGGDKGLPILTFFKASMPQKIPSPEGEGLKRLTLIFKSATTPLQLRVHAN